MRKNGQVAKTTSLKTERKRKKRVMESRMQRREEEECCEDCVPRNQSCSKEETWKGEKGCNGRRRETSKSCSEAEEKSTEENEERGVDNFFSLF